MKELPPAIPDVNVLLALEPEELGAKLLFLVRRRNERMFHPGGMANEIWGHEVPAEIKYPYNRREAVGVSLIEAWHWLEAQGLIVPAADENGRNGYRILSRRALQFESDAEFLRIMRPLDVYREKRLILASGTAFGCRLCRATLILRHFKQ